METQAQVLAAGASAGVFVELFDAAGNCLGQAVYLDWNERPIPRIGDTMSIDATGAWSARAQLKGHVRARHFDVQQDDAGNPCIWVRLELEELPGDRSRRGKGRASRAIEFSRN